MPCPFTGTFPKGGHSLAISTFHSLPSHFLSKILPLYWSISLVASPQHLPPLILPSHTLHKIILIHFHHVHTISLNLTSPIQLCHKPLSLLSHPSQNLSCASVTFCISPCISLCNPFPPHIFTIYVLHSMSMSLMHIIRLGGLSSK